MDALVALWDLVSLVGMVAAVTVCFLKGRKWFGWFGIAMYVLGAMVWFQLFSLTRDGDLAEGWLVPAILQFVLVLVLVAVIALGPAKPDSWWARKYEYEGDVEAQ